jgi:hypothetical protein
MLELLRRLDRRRWSVHVACFHTHGAWFDRLPLDAAVTVFPVRSFRRPAAFFVQLRAFARWCRQTRIAVVHTVDMPATIFGLPGAAAAGVPLRIANRREIDPGRTMVKMGLQRAAYGFARTSVELGFIDGAHSRPHVDNDTRKMAIMMSERGLVFWHDYGGGGRFRELTMYLEELAAQTANFPRAEYDAGLGPGIRASQTRPVTSTMRRSRVEFCAELMVCVSLSRRVAVFWAGLGVVAPLSSRWPPFSQESAHEALRFCRGARAVHRRAGSSPGPKRLESARGSQHGRNRPRRCGFH